ncbi:MAG: ArsC family transcriptional regulator [Oscillospiraceae bacterium]|nr:ArsC family transcriptional regulator [Oscillospiraceae bacterium]
MNVQIFGKAKCFDTKKAERFFKERGVKTHNVAVLEKGLSKGELTSVVAAVKAAGGIDAIADAKSADFHLFCHLTSQGKFDKLLDCPALLKTPIVRLGKIATVGYCPQVWESWLKLK